MHREPLSVSVDTNSETTSDIGGAAWVLEAVLDLVRDAVLIVDDKGAVVFANRHCQDLFGRTSSTMVSHPLEMLISPALRAESRGSHRHDRRLDRPMTGDPLHDRAMRADGTTVPVDISVAPVTTLMGSFVAMVVRELGPHPGSQLVQPLGPGAGAALAQSQQAALLGSWDEDLVTGRTHWSPQLYELLGLDPGTVTPGAEAFCGRVHPDDLPALLAETTRARIEGGRVRAEVRLSARPRSGQEKEHPGAAAETGRTVAILAWIECDPSGRPVHVLGTVEDVTARVDLEEAARASALWLRRALDASVDGFTIGRAVRDGHGAITGFRRDFVNAAGAAGFVGDPDQLYGRDMFDAYPEGRDNGALKAMVAVLETGTPLRRKIKMSGPSWHGWNEGVTVRLDADTVLSTWRNVTEMMETQHGLAIAVDQAGQARAVLDAALNATDGGFAVFALDVEDGDCPALRVLHANSTAIRTLGIRPGDLVDAAPTDALSRDVISRVRRALAPSPGPSPGDTQPQPPSVGGRAHVSDDAGVWTTSYDLVVARVGPGQAMLSWRDATRTERARREQERDCLPAQYTATHDALTGLPNRLLLHQRLTDALEHCPAGDQIAVAVCDLTDLTEVNSRYGTAAGDTVLQATAERLRQLLGPHETAARLDGDEFALLLPHPRTGQDAQDWLTTIRDHLSQPVAVRDLILAPSVSLGLTLGTSGTSGTSHDAEALLARAHHALHRSKATGRPVLATETPAEAEAARLSALQAYDVHNPGLDGFLRAITQVAAGACNTEYALITFVDAGVQWVRAANTLDLGGYDEPCGPRHLALCDHTIRGRDLLVIPDITQDPRFRPSTHTSWQLGIAFYAGAPLITPEGRPIGTLCVMDSAATTLSERQRRSLAALAEEVVAALAARRTYPRQGL